MFGFGKKKKTAKLSVAKPTSPSKTQYRDALESVVGKNGIDTEELDDLVVDLDEDPNNSKKAAPDQMTFDPEDLDGLDDLAVGEEVGEEVGLLDEFDMPDIDDTADEGFEDLDELIAADEEPERKPVDPAKVLKQRPVEVTNEETKHKRTLQATSIDEVEDEATFDGLTTDDALALLSEVEFDDAQEDENDILTRTDPEPETVYEDEADEDEFLEEVEEEPESDTEEPDEASEETPAPVPAPVPETHTITQEEAFAALNPVQQAILRQINQMDTATLKTQAQMVEENLYMQSQIREWSNAYALLMTHLNEWQEYATSLRDTIVKQNDEFENEKEHLIHRYEIKMRNLSASLEADMQEREDKILRDQELAKSMIEEASRLAKQSRDHDAEHQKTVDGLRDQIKVLTTRPNLSMESPIPVAPADFVSPTRRAPVTNQFTGTDEDELEDLFDNDSWG